MKNFVLLLLFVFSGCNLFSQSLTTETSELFSGSGNCSVCHAASEGVLMTSDNEDISPVTLWRSTMMGNANKDPLWQAKVTAEVAEHPALKAVIEDKCNTCHSPMGRTEAIHQGAQSYSFDDAMTSEMSRDGVTCTVCHQVQPNNLGSDESFSGKYEITDVHKIYGPYESPTAMPMFNQSGFTPEYSDHVNNSELCATCHTLFTPFVDDDGAIAGYFPEQTPYLEWENSIYPAQSTECQTCHMPAVDESMKIASSPFWLETKRTPIWKHDFAGGNVFMNRVLKDNADEIEVAASETELDNTRIKTTELLEKQTLNLLADATYQDDSLVVNVEVENLSGHKIPSGFPSRRIWLHLVVEDGAGNMLFESGKWNQEGRIVGVDEGFEPHHDVIRKEDEVQIYQAIMQDVNDEVTYTLLRGAKYGKDNRIPPKGFVSTIAGYESIAILGQATNDSNFNHYEDGSEGAGSDRVTYKIPTTVGIDSYHVTVEALYQTIAPGFADDLFLHDTDKVNTFEGYYDNADKAPVLIRRYSFNPTSTGAENINEQSKDTEVLHIYPNPFHNSTRISFHLSESTSAILQILDMAGNKVETLSDSFKQAGDYSINYFSGDLPAGIYLCILDLGITKYSKKIIVK